MTFDVTDLLLGEMDDPEAEWCDPDEPTFDTIFEGVWLPRYPMAGDRKKGPKYRMSREKALTKAYIEANPLCMTSLTIVDHDGGRADEIAGLCGLPTPSYIPMNRHTRNGHIVYAWKSPICVTDAARRAPVNLLARIEQGLNDVLGGDVAYAGTFTKNPMHAEHIPLWGPETALYDLADLARPLDRLKALPRRATSQREQRTLLANSLTGRNCALFDMERKWAYTRVRDYKNQQEWDEVAFAYAWDRNEAIIGPAFTAGPMSWAETGVISRSVSGWTWKHILRTFSEEQARRGSRGGKVMTEAKREANRKRATKVDRDIARMIL
ncbi:replication initiation protein [Nocardia sp. NBC_01388]|uniref:replication initiation protein n=1 Tax=Nocardia sp. NBC_01388 TaxID=2903596 RepID=UPI002F91A8F9